MTTTVLLALPSGPERVPGFLLAIDEITVLERLARQVKMTADTTVVLTWQRWAERCAAVVPDSVVRSVDAERAVFTELADIAEHAEGDLVLAEADLIVQDAAVRWLLTDPRLGTGCLVGTLPSDRHPSSPVRVERSDVMAPRSASRPCPRPTHEFTGLLRIGPHDVALAARICRELGSVVTAGESGAWGQVPSAHQNEQNRQRPISAMVLAALVGHKGVVSARRLVSSPWATPCSAQEAEAVSSRLARTRPDQPFLDGAVKEVDGFFTTFLVSPYSRHVAVWCARRGMTPNQVTVVSMALGVAAAMTFATGTRSGLVAGAVLLQLAFTADCVDGQLARYKFAFSRFGAWLDSMFDRAKEYLVYGGLAFGATRVDGDPAIWLLAAAALILQTTRHLADVSFEVAHPRIPRHDPAGMATFDPTTPGPPADADASGGTKRARLLRRARQLEDGRILKWGKRIITLPIGERFAVISVTAALTRPEVTFITLLVWGVVGAAYTLTGRLLRTVA